jgi:hypothetical protein
MSLPAGLQATTQERKHLQRQMGIAAQLGLINYSKVHVLDTDTVPYVVS